MFNGFKKYYIILQKRNYGKRKEDNITDDY